VHRPPTKAGKRPSTNRMFAVFDPTTLPSRIPERIQPPLYRHQQFRRRRPAKATSSATIKAARQAQDGSLPLYQRIPASNQNHQTPTLRNPCTKIITRLPRIRRGFPNANSDHNWVTFRLASELAAQPGIFPNHASVPMATRNNKTIFKISVRVQTAHSRAFFDTVLCVADKSCAPKADNSPFFVP